LKKIEKEKEKKKKKEKEKKNQKIVFLSNLDLVHLLTFVVFVNAQKKNMKVHHKTLQLFLL